MPPKKNNGRVKGTRGGPKGQASKIGNTVQPPLKVFIKLTWLDPKSTKDAPKKRPFPKDLPVHINYTIGANDRVTLGDDGLLAIEMGSSNARSRKAFQLTWVMKPNKRFILCEEEGKDEKTEWGDLPDGGDKGVVPGRVFALPMKFTTLSCDWKVDDKHADKGRYDKDKGEFTLLVNNSPKDIGTKEKPLELTLDPHWLYLRVEFFDRYFGHSDHDHKPVTTPALMFEGHRFARLRPRDEHRAETQSNWTIKKGDHEALVQCVPWILQKNLDPGHTTEVEKKPDRVSLLLFRTKEKTFVKSKSATEREITVETGDLKLNADRLKLYDLPKLWMSRNQWSRLSDDEKDQGWFQDKVMLETTLEKPLTVSLDDIVLSHVDAGTEKPFNVKATELPLLFYHTFKEATGDEGGRAGASYSKEGIYQPGRTLAKAKALAKTGATNAKVGEARHEKRKTAEDGKRNAARKKPTSEEGKNQAEYDKRKEILAEGTKEEPKAFADPHKSEATQAGTDAENGFEAVAVYPFSEIKRPGHLPLWHIVDYPHWTRLIVCAGDLFDVFDQRTHQDLTKDDDASWVVGARAAKRWYDRSDWVEPNNQIAAQPALVRHPSGASSPSFALQVFYKQEYLDRMNVFGGTKSIGRADLAMLRLCDHDGETEVAAVFNYVKLNFTDNSGGGVNFEEYQNKLVQNVIERYHGDDGLGFSERPELRSRDMAVKLHALFTMFLQVTEQPRAHYAVSIKALDRASANAVQGTASLGPSYFEVNGAGGRFSSAHETGHFISLPDDYGEKSNYAGYGQLDFSENVPGLPFDLDELAMMKSNKQPRARNFWFAAEWLRELTKTTSHQNGVPLKVWHGGTYPNFFLPRHASRPVRCYANIPVAKVQINGPNDAAGCAYLYRLGKDKTSEDVLPTYFGGGSIDGVLVFVVRVFLHFRRHDGLAYSLITNTATSQQYIDVFLPRLKAAVEAGFNKKWVATGDFTTDEGEQINFSRCMVHFQPRFLVKNYGTPAQVQQKTGKATLGAFNNLVNAVHNQIPEHFTLNVQPRNDPGDVDGAAGGGVYDMYFDLPQDNNAIRDSLQTFFQTALGFTALPAPLNEVSDRVQLVFPNATVSPA